MKLTGAQIKARLMLRRAPDGTLTSTDQTGIRRQTIEALARAGLVKLERANMNRQVRHRSGRTSVKGVVVWKATLQPELPTDDQMAELDLIIKNGEGILRDEQRQHAAAYVARVTPDVALDGSPARSPQYHEVTAYKECLEWPTAKLLDTVMMLRTMTGQSAQPIPEQRRLSDRTDVWVLFSKKDDGTPDRELGRVRASTQNTAALLGNSLLNTRGGYAMRRLHTQEIGRWVEDFRARGLVLRLERTDTGFRVFVLASGENLIHRVTAAEAKRDALADLTTLYTATADTIPADQKAEQ